MENWFLASEEILTLREPHGKDSPYYATAMKCDDFLPLVS